MKTRTELYGDSYRRHHPIIDIILLLLLAGIIVGGVSLSEVHNHLPVITKSKLMGMQGHYSTIVSSDGKTVWGNGNGRELVARKNQVPSNLKNALLSIEDRDFYKEKGVNYLRTVKAVLLDLVHMDRAQGGSTLTEQLVKNSMNTQNGFNNKRIVRKLQEIMLAHKIGSEYSKNTILTMYVNKVYMGSGLFGMRTASEYYFNRPLDRVSIPQAAILAGTVQSPSNYDPFVHPKTATKRRNTVIKAMYSNKKIDRKTEKGLLKEPISTELMPSRQRARASRSFAHNQLIADDYTQSVIQQMDRKGVDLSKSSYNIKIPLNMGFQSKLMNIIDSAKNVPWPSKKTNVAAVVIDNKTGQPVAQVGSRYKKSLGSLDQAIESNRSTGSIIKPILDYAPAMDDLGWDTGTPISDKPYKYKGTDSSVYDWDDQYQGNLTVNKALTNSRNIPAVKALTSVGLNRANKLSRLAGLPKSPFYADAIGTEASPADMASAYSSLADYGNRKPLSYISSVNGHKQKESNIKVMSPQTAFMLNKILENVPQKHELGADAYIHGLTQAGKSGSVGYADGNKGLSKNAVSDIWYAGYTKQYTMVIWTGYNNPKKPLHQKDAAVSEMIYQDMMKFLMKQKGADDSEWSMPSNMESYHKGGAKQYAPKDVHTVASPSLEPKKPARHKSHKIKLL